MPEAYDWQGAPISGNWQEAERIANEQAAQQNFWQPSSNSWDAGDVQYNAMTGEYVEPPKPQEQQKYKNFADNMVDYFGTVNNDVKNKYEQGFTSEDQLQQALKSGPFVGDGGFVFNEDGSAGDSRQLGPQTIRDFNGDGVVSGDEAIDNFRSGQNGEREWNSMDARAQYMTPEVARWYANNGYVSEDKLADYNAWVDEAEKNQVAALPKSLASGQYGFNQYDRNAGDKLWNDINGANNAMQSALGDLGAARSNNAVYQATHKDGSTSDVSKDIREELYNQLEARTANPVYELPSGERMNLEDINASEVTNQGTHVFFGDTYAGELDEVLTPDYSGLLDTALKQVKTPITTSDGAVWTDEDIINNVPEDRILQWLIDPNTEQSKVADAVKQLRQNAGKSANYGFMGWNKPSEQSDGMLEELAKGNILPQMADLAASSAAYFSPLTMIPVGAGQVLSAAQGVNTQGRNQSNFGTVENPAVAAPFQALATVGESVLGGRAAGRLGSETRGLYETLGDKLASAGLIPQAAMKSQNPLARMAREGTFEGLEEVTTSPLYEIAENAQNAYANNLINDYGYETNEKDANTSWQDRLGNAMAQAPGDFVGGALLGGPLEGGSMALKFKDTNRRWNDYKLSKQLGFDVPEIQDWMKTNRS